jgi:nucleoside-diphosphate-sugar epimerase
MKVLVVGASRGTGAELVRELAARGHLVTAFARTSHRDDKRVRYLSGDVSDEEAVEKAVIGQDAVIVTLGIPDNPFVVRLTRRAGSRLDVRSAGTANVISAMKAHGVPRLVVQSTYGIGETYAHLPLSLKAFFTLAFRPQVKDHELQEATVRSSGLDWTIVRPVVLTDDPVDLPAYVGLEDRVPSMQISRRQVARVAADALDRDDWRARVLSVSQPA